jgi:hypothetical protein
MLQIYREVSDSIDTLGGYGWELLSVSKSIGG